MAVEIIALLCLLTTPADLAQVRFQLERAQEGLQRQLVHAEGGIAVLEARLADAQSGEQLPFECCCMWEALRLPGASETEAPASPWHALPCSTSWADYMV